MLLLASKSARPNPAILLGVCAILDRMSSLTAAEAEAQQLTTRWGIVYVIRVGPEFHAISERRYNERGLEDEIVRVFESPESTRNRRISGQRRVPE